MRNAAAVAFVVVFLAACGQYVYSRSPSGLPLIDRDSASSELRREYLQNGGLLK